MHTLLLRSVRTYFPFVFFLIVLFLLFSGCGKTVTEPGAPLRGVLSGTIYDAETRTPLAGVTVSLFDGKHAAVTDGSGNFEIDSIPIGIDKITISKARYTTFTDSVVIITDHLTTYTTFIMPSFKGWITGWQPVPSGTQQKLTNASYVDSVTAYVCGFAGTLLRSSNAGKTWTGITLPTSENLYCVKFFDRHTGFVMGNKGTILRTTDGGVTWNTIPGKGYDFRNLSFSDPLNGMAVGSDGNGGPAIFVTDDGGQTWTDRSGRILQSIGTNATPLYGVFRNGLLAFVGSSNGTIYRTNTEGVSWSLVHNGAQWCRSISFGDNSNGTYVGAGGDIENTTDGGFSWSGQNPGLSATLGGITHSDPRHVTIVGETGVILHSRTSGSAWINQSISTIVTLYNSSFADSVTGVIVGDNGTILLPVTE